MNFNLNNMEVISTLIEGLEMRAEIHFFLDYAKLLSDLVPVGVNRTGPYSDDLGNFLGCLAFI